jgi:putative aldouronate transport system substrate-binding protein
MAMALLVSLLGACGSGETTAETAESSGTSSVEAEASAVQEAPEPETPAEPVSAEEEEASEVEEEPAPAITITYPLEGDLTELHYWTSFDSNAFGSFGLNSYNDLQALDLVEEATGVRYVFDEVSFFSASEQFNLVIASGDLPDVIPAARYYTGGLAQAYADEIILDLTDLLPESAPDYYAQLMSRDDTTLRNIRTDGMDLELVSMYDTYVNDGGSYVREDWLEDLGVEWPDTFDGFIDLLYQVHDAYNCAYTYPIDPGAGIAGAEAYFGTELFSLRSSSSDLAVYVDDGVVKSGVTSDGFREYLELAQQLYKDGIFNSDFYVSELDRGSTMSGIGDGDIFIWSGRADTMNDPFSYTSDPNMKIKPVTTYFPGDSGEYDFMDEILYANTNEGLSLTTSCQDPELILNFYNYFYTEEGILLCNYGIEGVAYTMENGQPTYTDLILNNPDGMNFNTAQAIYGMTGVVTKSDNEAKLAAYSDEVVAAIDVFSSLEGTSTKHTYPNGASLGTEAANRIANQLTAVTSYASEQGLRFVCGEALTDEAWDTYVQACNDYGLLDCVAAYQEAYDAYMAE